MADLTKTLNDEFSSGSSSGNFSSGGSTGFEGWLLKFGSREFPMECIAEEGYSCTPNQRQEVEAWQDNHGNLHRDTASHYRTKIEITTMDELTREDIQNIQSVMNSSVVNKQERKCKIAYWNDEDGAYKDATVYIPDTQFKIKRVDRKKKIIYYSSIRIALIEY